MKQRLIQKQTLSLKMNQSLIQSLQVLQFNSMELYDYINDIALENPLIEEVVYEENIEDYTFQNKGEAVSMDINPAEKTFYEQLKDQIFMLEVAEDVKPLINYGIDSLNEAGYLELSLEDWAAACETTIEKVEEALSHIQSLEPVGVGARSLGECLLLQIKQMNDYETYMDEILLHHIDWIADLNYDAIIDLYEIDEQDITTLMELIQSCNPRPGEMYNDTELEYIIPEAKIYKEDNAWKITFYNWSSPKIVLSDSFLKVDDKQTKDYLKGKKEELAWLENVIQYRSSTIERVIYQLVKEQEDFFEYDILKIRPLRLVDMANKLQLHISTISRAISNKYIETPHGILALKFFFPSGINKGENEIASIVIKNRIAELVKNENKYKPLSDQKLKEKLEEEYRYQVARRTVMKYRQSLNIPASYKRKRET